MLLVHHSTPRINLLVNVDLHGAYVGATAIERGSKRQFAIAVDIEGRHHNDADRPHVGRAIAQAAAASIHWAGVHAGAAADALERRPEPFHRQSFRSAIVNDDDVHFPVLAWPAEVRSVLRNRLPSGAA